MRLLINVKAISGALYLKALIKRVELAKFLFVHEIEYGGDVFIPNELSQDRLPHAFRYYDPILSFVQDNIDDDKRLYYLLKNQLAYLLYSKSDPIKDELEKLGIIKGELYRRVILWRFSAQQVKHGKMTKEMEAANKIKLQKASMRQLAAMLQSIMKG